MPDDLTSRIAQAWANTGLAIEDLWDVLETQIRVRIWDTAFWGFVDLGPDRQPHFGR